MIEMRAYTLSSTMRGPKGGLAPRRTAPLRPRTRPHEGFTLVLRPARQALDPVSKRGPRHGDLSSQR